VLFPGSPSAASRLRLSRGWVPVSSSVERIGSVLGRLCRTRIGIDSGQLSGTLALPHDPCFRRRLRLGQAESTRMLRAHGSPGVNSVILGLAAAHCSRVNYVDGFDCHSSSPSAASALPHAPPLIRPIRTLDLPGEGSDVFLDSGEAGFFLVQWLEQRNLILSVHRQRYHRKHPICACFVGCVSWPCLCSALISSFLGAEILLPGTRVKRQHVKCHS
jgi:hypothetical protein